MLRYVPRSRCAVALAIGSLVYCSIPHTQAAGNNRSPAPRRTAMAQEYDVPVRNGPRVYIEQGSPHNGAYVGSPEYDGGIYSGAGAYGGGYSGGYGGGTYSGSSCGGACDCCTPLYCAPAYQAPRLAAWADWLYLQPTGADVAHAQQQDGIGGAGTVPFGDIGTQGMNHNSGVRIGAGLGIDPCSAVLVSWTWFESDGRAQLLPPDIPGGLGAVGSFVHHPEAAVLASVGPVDTIYEIDFHLADVLYNRLILTGKHHYVSGLVGVQYGHLEQRFGQFGVFSGGQGGAIDTTTSIEFDGVGLKGGLEAERQMSPHLSVYGRATGAVMSGRFRSRYNMLNVTTDVLLAQSNWKDDRIVPQLEYELGVAWTTLGGCVRVSSGYMFSHWFNVITTPELITAVQADRYVDVGDTLSFDGFVTRVEVRW